MIDPPVLVETAPRLVAFVHLVIPREAIGREMGPGLREVLGAVAAQGLAPTGPWFTHHLRVVPAQWDFQICVPVSAKVTPTGRVQAGELPAVRAARAILRGGYEQLGPAWGALDAWIREQGHAPAEDLYECYRIGPETSPDPAAWETELTRPLLVA